MNDYPQSRRSLVRDFLAMTALGAIGSLRSARAAVSEDVLGGADITVPDFKGRVIGRGSDNYELWRQSMVWHDSKPDRYPAVIVRATDREDVRAAIAYARRNGMKVSVRSGGHNSTGSSLRDDSLVIDLSALTEIRIDAHNGIASIEPGVRSSQLLYAAQKKGFSFPVPHCDSVGMSGFLMGGGIGWNYPQHGGVSTFSIVGAEVITAEGEILEVSATQNPDLYWTVRGVGPGFFGVVTRLDLSLYPHPDAVLASSYIFRLDDLQEAVKILDKIRKTPGVHERVEVLGVLMENPHAPAELPPRERKIFFLTAFAFEESEAAAEKILRLFADSPLRELAVQHMEFQSYDFGDLYAAYFSLEDSAGRMARYAVDNVFTDRGSDVLVALAEHVRDAPAKDCHILAVWGMKLARRADACFSGLGDCYVGCYAIWDGEENDRSNFDWLRGAIPKMDPYATGHYVNEVEGRGNPQRYRQCYSSANWNRLEKLRADYDPQGVFHSYLGHS
ncbi:FAD-binding oxidoreductase [Kineobactrum salinum]|uniref:FAD-binding oxidoreductase n=1 Tax=Kineobactrum salinum TaxID=2708301 RepID=A0A6C0U4M7_9GAMM|nr:FAD-binding oxidoreductase [Kineobactrum salinum]QIB66803.1 FAD-binding oxidoreductase [Kineobactrum salinum]